MKTPQNISERLTLDIKNISFGLHLLKESIESQQSEDPKKISEKTTDYMLLVKEGVDDIIKSYCPEKIKEIDLKKAKNAKSNQSHIEALTMRLADKVSLSDLSYYLSSVKKDIKNTLSKYGIQASIKIVFNEYGMDVSLTNMNSLQMDSFYSTSQEDIEENIIKTNQATEVLKSSFDCVIDIDESYRIKITERSMEMLFKIFKETGYSFLISEILTDKFTSNPDVLDSVKLRSTSESISHYKNQIR